MKKLVWLLLILPVSVLADDIDVTSTDGLTKTITVTTAGATGATGPAGAAGPAFTGGTLTTPVLGIAANNCAAIPFSFASDATTGLCSTAAGTLNLYTTNVSRLSLASTAATFTTPILASNGALLAPAYSFASAAFDGAYWVAGGVGGLYIHSDGPYLNIELDPGHDGTAPSSALSFHTTNGTQLINMTTAAKYAAVALRGSANDIVSNVTDGADTNLITQTKDSTTFDHPVLLPDGAVGAPALAFSGDTDTGIYYVATGVNVAVAGAKTLGLEADSNVSLPADAAKLVLGAGGDLIVTRDAAATLQLGADAALATAQTLKAADSSGAGNAGASLTLVGGSPGAGGAQGNVIVGSGSQLQTLDTIDMHGLPATTGCTSKSLTDAAAAVTFARVAVATNGYTAGEFEWTATTTDGTDQIVTFGKQPIVGVDKAGTVTCATSAQYATTTAATNANTLVCTVTTVTSTTNCDAQVTCTNNTAGDQAIDFCWRFDMPIETTVSVP